MTTTRAEAVARASKHLAEAANVSRTMPEDEAYETLWSATRIARRLLKPFQPVAESAVSTESLDDWLARTEPDL